METVTDFIFLGSKVTAYCDCCHKSKSNFLLGRKVMTNLGSILKSRDITLLTKIHVWMWDMDHNEGWMLKNWCLQTVVMVKTLESPLDSKEIRLVNPKRNKPWIFIGRTDAETEFPILWPPDMRSWLIEKALDARKGWGQEEKGATEDGMFRWHHWLYRYEFEQTLGDSEGKGKRACWSSWGHKK